MRDSEKKQTVEQGGSFVDGSPVYVTKIQIDEQDNQE